MKYLQTPHIPVKHAACIIAALIALSHATDIGAQTYPLKPIRVILPFPPGGGADALMRPIAPRLAELTGQQWVIDNRPGANGNIAAELVVNAAPDGYTLFFANSSLVINPSLYSKLSFDVARDFAPITLAAMTPSVLATHPSLPVKTVADLIALARRQPGKLNFASGGAGNTMHLGVELLKSMAKVDMLHVPYKGGGPAIIDVIAGQCDFLVVNIGPVIGHIRSGKLSPLAVTSKTRAAALPNVPTVAESGLPGYESTTWYGFVGPAALSKDVVTRVNTAVLTALKNPDVRERYLALGAEPVTNTPEQFAAFMRKDMQDWAKVVKVSGARLD
ncbi:MAG TPA: tripartite tricarboxylate transporter substrate binding protein [Burkholderiales bacterium]|nr:tripartite tricarboxylate transporter substrate binding protein [Burkholderiales bacterium]